LLVFLFLWLAGVILEGGHPEQFLQVTATCHLLAFVLGGLMMSHGVRALGRAFAVALGADVRDTAEAEVLAGLCHRGRRLAWTGGGVHFVCCLMHVVSVLDEPERIGPGIAVGMVGLLYGAIIGEIGFGSAQRWCEAARRAQAPAPSAVAAPSAASCASRP